jgi:hypothetical protein
LEKRSKTLGFEVRAFDCTVRVATESAHAYSVLDRYIFPSFPRADLNSAHPEIFIRIAQSAGEFHLLVDDAPVVSASQAIELVPHLIHAVDETVVQHLSTLRAVHAGTVLWNGRALLIPGKTHSGKSSMVAELLRRGATYFSDEYALVDAEGRVHPYPRPLLLRNDSDEQFPVLPGECNAEVGKAPAPVGWILLLEYQPGSAWSIQAVPQSLALLGLLQNTPHALADSPQMASAFQSAVAGAACYAGCRPDAVDAAEKILELIGRQP